MEITNSSIILLVNDDDGGGDGCGGGGDGDGKDLTHIHTHRPKTIMLCVLNSRSLSSSTADNCVINLY